MSRYIRLPPRKRDLTITIICNKEEENRQSSFSPAAGDIVPNNNPEYDIGTTFASANDHSSLSFLGTGTAITVVSEAVSLEGDSIVKEHEGKHPVKNEEEMCLVVMIIFLIVLIFVKVK